MALRNIACKKKRRAQNLINRPTPMKQNKNYNATDILGYITD